MFRDSFRMHSKYREDAEKQYGMGIERDVITVSVFNVNNFKEYAMLCIDGERVMLKISRGNDNNSKIILLSVYNDKIIKTTSGFLIEKNKYSKKDVTKEIEYTNKIRYI